MIIKYGVTGILLFLLTILSVNISVGQADLGKIRCICIDAGHGGRDPGAIGSKVYEKNVVLAVALKLGKLIEKTYPDIKVVYIRDKDVFVELSERTRIANHHKADLFISVHANALDIKKYPKNKYVRGIETFILGTNNSQHNLQVAMKENSVIHYEDDYSVKYEGFDPSRVESYIMFNMLRNMHLDKSLTLASLVQQELVKTTQHVDRDVRQGPLWVLKDVAMPSILVEIGYITNPDEERYMMSVSGQAKIAQGIFEGFRKYKAKVEKKVSVQPEQVTENKAVSLKNTPTAGNGTKFDTPVYAIQVASVPDRVKNSASLCPGRKVCEINGGGRFRYYVAESNDLQKVKEELSGVRKKVKDCFIIAIYNNKVISVAEARKLEKK